MFRPNGEQSGLRTCLYGSRKSIPVREQDSTNELQVANGYEIKFMNLELEASIHHPLRVSRYIALRHRCGHVLHPLLPPPTFQLTRFLHSLSGSLLLPHPPLQTFLPPRMGGLLASLSVDPSPLKGRPSAFHLLLRKTEAIHWEAYRQRSPAPFSPIQLGGQPITPSTSVSWLGFWFDQRRTGTVHF